MKSLSAYVTYDNRVRCICIGLYPSGKYPPLRFHQWADAFPKVLTLYFREIAMAVATFNLNVASAITP